MRLVGLADLHCQTPILPEGDILAIAGDLTWRGSLPELEKVCKYLKAQDFEHKIVIAGNHDWCFENKANKAKSMLTDIGVTYLKDSGITINNVSFYGSPWQPWFHSWAFNVTRGQLHQYWDKIPVNTDVLLVHGPPHGYGDLCTHGARVGCEELLLALREKLPKHVLYGHIHEDVGQWNINNGLTNLYNCSIGPDHNWPPRSSGSPIVIDLC